MRIHVFESETRDIFHRSEDGKGVVRFFFHITTDADTVSIYYLEMQNILGKKGRVFVILFESND